MGRGFLHWLNESEHGRKEFRSPNNHGLWYDAIRVDGCGLYGPMSCKPVRLPSIRWRRGSLRRLRTTVRCRWNWNARLALHYSTFALEAVALADRLVADTGYSIWHYRSPEGRSLEDAVAYLLPYYCAPETWPHRQIAPFDRSRGARILYAAGRALGRDEWGEAARSIGCRPPETNFETLLYFDM